MSADPKFTHLAEQAQASATDIGKMWGNYHRGMVEAGMHPSEATKVLAVHLAVTSICSTIERSMKEDES